MQEVGADQAQVPNQDADSPDAQDSHEAIRCIIVVSDSESNNHEATHDQQHAGRYLNDAFRSHVIVPPLSFLGFAINAEERDVKPSTASTPVLRFPNRKYCRI
jgi:hypothetical protein